VILLCALLCTIAFSGVVYCAPEEIINVYSKEYPGLEIEIMAPAQALIGDVITVTVTAKATNEVFVEFLQVTIYGALNATERVVLSEITHLENSSFSSSHSSQYNITIPTDICPGLTYAMISGEWDSMAFSYKIPESGFALTYITNMDLEALQAKYDALNSTYNDLLQDYTELESNFQQDVNSTRNLMWVFVITTVVAAITVFVLLIRKPKKIWI
jgi:hypothetical protein